MHPACSFSCVYPTRFVREPPVRRSSRRMVTILSRCALTRATIVEIHNRPISRGSPGEQRLVRFKEYSQLLLHRIQNSSRQLNQKDTVRSSAPGISYPRIRSAPHRFSTNQTLHVSQPATAFASWLSILQTALEDELGYPVF